ncbi:MAG: HDOD domain-containing protein [Enterobacterales bacterium]|nr:HDOD domain-containing protein [Enterobacterales bacterium]
MAVIPSNIKSKINLLVKKYQGDPILPLELDKIIPRLRKKDASVKDFVNFYQRDPLLCAYLIDLAWQATSTRENHPTAADHAMSTIGITGARQFLVNIGEDESTQLSKEVVFLLTSSLLAAELAKNLCKESNKKQNLYWASLAHQFPDIALWHIQPKAMWKIQYQQAKSINKIEKIDQKELGFTRSQWRQQLSTVYHMSELNQLTYKKKPPNHARQLVRYANQGYTDKTPCLKEWHKTDSWLILTANWLAKSLIAPWLKNSHQHYYHLVKQAYGLSDKQIKQAISLSLRNSSENLHDSHLLVPASCSFYLPQAAVYPKWLTQAPLATKKVTTIQPATNKTTTNHQHKPDLKQLLNKLINSPEKFSNSAELLTESFKAITVGLGFSRVVFH